MNNKLKQFIKESENGKIFSATFIKKDGTERRMNARRGVSKGITGQGMSFDPMSKGLLVVFDMQKLAYRMINLFTLKQVNINGKQIKL